MSKDGALKSAIFEIEGNHGSVRAINHAAEIVIVIVEMNFRFLTSKGPPWIVWLLSGIAENNRPFDITLKIYID